jgi:diguanylate cyclase (GGDEF)-like protein
MGLVVLTFTTTALALTLPGTPSPWQQLPRDMVYQWLVMVSLTLSILSSFVLGYVVVMRLVRRLEHLSHHDGLTGLLNRRAIEAMLDREVQRLQRFGQPFSLLLIDIDHFKRINDRLDQAAVAGALKKEAREVDRVARFGGEEFCVVLPHTSEEGALHAAERLRAAVAALDVRWGDEGVSVTISIGLACAEHPTETLSQLLRRADEALYEVKAAGRNRVVLSALPAAA